MSDHYEDGLRYLIFGGRNQGKTASMTLRGHTTDDSHRINFERRFVAFDLAKPGSDATAIVTMWDGRECTCPRCMGETCGCRTMRMPPCSVCTESCDPDDPDTRTLEDRCPKCGCDVCGCDRRPYAT